MTTPAGEPAAADHPRLAELLPELDINRPERHRRWTVLLRLLLLIPQFIVVYALGIAATVIVVIGWFAALFMGRLPTWAFGFLSGYVAYYARVNAYLYLLTDTYPPFAWSTQDHPARFELPPQDRLNRLAVLFRIILIIPAYIVAVVVIAGWMMLAFFFWLIVLILGRIPTPIFGASAAVLRYELRYMSYGLLVTAAYPKLLFGDTSRVAATTAHTTPTPQAAPAGAVPQAQDTQGAPERASDTRPLLLSPGAKALLVVIIVLGVLGAIGGGAAGTAAETATDGTDTVVIE
ncbi:DUF4389 domain-containing protein [Haloechinothrix sp. LS1_15]|uniref:DUF4389 domain-containing protein n=1 Tax=Haloechinothrix sp. LS1_15 TaxID=2652248 RepID=UPI0029483E51|nr:DUF4389 domain-containing protein [Haloechinothrix sp. LS1_15]MDV6013647.1 DUF4389 domain-containing protein [Haloechinothrix sp. LS1_15]